MDGRTDMMELINALREYENASKKDTFQKLKYSYDSSRQYIFYIIYGFFININYCKCIALTDDVINK
jgi:hypothetical protein